LRSGSCIQGCDPATTLIAVASKTFTTTETMTNAASAIEWLSEGGVDDPYGRVIALTASPDKAVEWGVDDTRVLPFAESVGGRYSLWSSIGFPVALALGLKVCSVSRRWCCNRPPFPRNSLEENVVVRAAFALSTHRLSGARRAVFAYDERLALLPDYLQQLEMDRTASALRPTGTCSTGRARRTWGRGNGCARGVSAAASGNASHPGRFPGGENARPRSRSDPSQDPAVNCFAQGAALMAGKASAIRRGPIGQSPLCDHIGRRTQCGHARQPDRVSRAPDVRFGGHAGINPFDQFGVELGKAIAKQIDAGGGDGFDPSTEALLAAAGIGV
jgi:glucose-6-phosphate isomerase